MEGGSNVDRSMLVDAANRVASQQDPTSESVLPMTEELHLLGHTSGKRPARGNPLGEPFAQRQRVPVPAMARASEKTRRPAEQVKAAINHVSPDDPSSNADDLFAEYFLLLIQLQHQSEELFKALGSCISREEFEAEVAAKKALEEKCANLEARAADLEAGKAVLVADLARFRAEKVATMKAQRISDEKLRAEYEKLPKTQSYDRAVDHWRESSAGQAFKRAVVEEFKNSPTYLEDQARFWASGFNTASREIQEKRGPIDLPPTFNGVDFLRTDGAGVWDKED